MSYLIDRFMIFQIKGENFWLFGKLIKEIVQFARKLFPSVGYAYTLIPTYPCGCIGFFLCSKEEVQLSTFRDDKMAHF